MLYLCCVAYSVMFIKNIIIFLHNIHTVGVSSAGPTGLSSFSLGHKGIAKNLNDTLAAATVPTSAGAGTSLHSGSNENGSNSKYGSGSNYGGNRQTKTLPGRFYLFFNYLSYSIIYSLFNCICKYIST